MDYRILLLACLESVEECWANDKGPSEVLQPRLSRRVLYKRELTARALGMHKAQRKDVGQQYEAVSIRTQVGLGNKELSTGMCVSYNIPEADVTGIDFSISSKLCLWDGTCQAFWREMQSWTPATGTWLSNTLSPHRDSCLAIPPLSVTHFACHL